MQLYKLMETEQRISESKSEIHSHDVKTNSTTTYFSPEEYILKFHKDANVIAKHEGNHTTYVLFESYDCEDKTYHSETYTTLIFTPVEEAKWVMTNHLK